MRPFEFACGTRIVFGPGRLAELGREARALGRRAMLVSYRDAGALAGEIDRARRELRAAGLDVIDFPGAEPDPDERLAVEGSDRARAEGADLILGLGGGSALDLAKAVAFMSTNPGEPFDYMVLNPARRRGLPALPCLAIPTTAGTGSEVSRGAVLTIADRELKGTIVDDAMAPRLALVDPELTTGMPPALTAATGVDALGHAIEATISRAATPMSACLGAESARIVFRDLERAFGDGSDMDARSGMAWAATLSGLAIASAGTVATHAMSHAVGSVLHVPHGVAVAALTVPALVFCAGAAPEELGRLAQAVGLECPTPAAFIDATGKLLESVGLPSELAVEPSAWSEGLPAMLARKAAESAPAAVGNTPREAGEAEMAGILARVLRPGTQSEAGARAGGGC